MNAVDSALVIFSEQPRAIKYWLANYTINIMPNMDATGSDCEERLVDETGMSWVYARTFIRGWMFDIDKKIDHIANDVLQNKSKQWMQ